MKTAILILVWAAIPFAHAQKCSNFTTQAEAQKYYDENEATYLDRDHDGEACECLEGGSAHGSPVCDKHE